MQTIRDESELPIPEDDGKAWHYIRSLTEPRVLMHPFSGETFLRFDGQRWEHPAMRVENVGGRGVSTPRAAWFDHAQYPYQSAKVA